jgi:hypothetical protein
VNLLPMEGTTGAVIMESGRGIPGTGVLLTALLDLNTLHVKLISNMTQYELCRTTVSGFTTHCGSERTTECRNEEPGCSPVMDKNCDSDVDDVMIPGSAYARHEIFEAQPGSDTRSNKLCRHLRCNARR